MPRGLIYGILALLVAGHIFTVGILTEKHSALRKTGYQEHLFLLPAPVLRVAALDFKGLASDFLFVKGMVFIGGFISPGGRFQLEESQWSEFYKIMDASTDLDPYFQDPYYIANAFLPWDAGMVRETNVLLDKGTRYRTWDWSLPFFSGFNFFYFLQDYDKASERIMVASRRPGSPPLLASLASKLAFKANKIESSIFLLEEMLKNTDDESTKKIFETRIKAYQAIFFLEQAVSTYRRQFKRAPANIEELIKRNIITELPKDPYGGKFYMDLQGNVRTTSEQLLMPHVIKTRPTSSSLRS
jgi:hypothetical protein